MLEFFGVLFFLSIPIGLFYLGYRFSSKRKRKPETRPDVEDKVMLHGHDMSKWHYLGHTRCSYVDETGKTTGEYPIFMFVSKTNEKRRSYHISNDTAGYVDKSHGFVNRYIKPWAAGEGEIYHRVQGEHSVPSDYLQEYMRDKFGAEWNETTHWWGTTDKAKYTSAQNKQKRERKLKTEAKPESNVVTVEFGKQA